ncbi:MAG: hypothetical protein ACJ76J_22080 [Thermoanaerobaculia bacterium]
MRRSVTGAALLLATGLAFAAPDSGTRILSDRPLPKALGIISDLRWASADSLFLAAGKSGALRLRFEPEWGEREILVPSGKSLWAAARIGASSRYLAVGAPAHTVAWRKLPAGELQAVPLYTVVDLDVFEDRLVVLGARKEERGRFAPDGAIAWIGSLDKNLADLKPVLFSVAGPGARPMDACGAFETGAVRFLGDGSFLVVPGVEPGIFLYDRTGKLLRSWEARAVGLDAECGLSDEQMMLLSASLEPRSAWINQRRVLDDIIALPQGAGLLIRQVANGKTNWQVKILRRDGQIASHVLPFTGPSPHWHLRADVQGKRIAYLLKEYAASSPPSPSRLVVTTLPE